MSKLIPCFFIFIGIFSCQELFDSESKKIFQKKHTISDFNYFINSQPITKIENIKSGEIEKFEIIIDTSVSKIIDKIVFNKVKITGYDESIYFGCHNSILYTYEANYDHYEPMFYLDSELSNYYSFFAGYDYIIDKSELLLDNPTSDTIYKFHMTEGYPSESNDNLIISRKSSSIVFKSLTFSKRKGIIEAILTKNELGETYRTL